MKQCPWKRCEVEFEVSNRENVWDLNDGRMPEGWRILSTRPTDRVESSFTVTFSVIGEPTFEDGERVRKMLDEVVAQ